ncbi:MAG: DUF2780 domain-containing protein [Sulfurimonadaceae bacterium]|nr:DUF2780 domain-containing protein [Sulfurimonadaceae bacterium]
MYLRLALSSMAAAGLLTSAQAFDFSSALKSATPTQEESTQQQSESSLLGSLTSQLGITETQAAGGTSAILNDASKNMSSSDQSKLTNAVPALSSFMGGSSDTSSGLLGSVMSNQTVSDQFSALGLDPAMVQQFIPIILDYVQTEGGSEMMNLLKSAL